MSQSNTPASDDATMTPEACGALLKQLFPALFTGGAKPLKLRIQADIQERAPGQFSKQVLSAFLRRFTGSTSYIQAVSRATHRFDLDGQEAGELTDEHRQVALQELARRRERQVAKRAEQEQAQRERASLLRDFERTTLTAANFCALKGLTEEALQAQLTLARTEATQAPAQPERRGHHRPGGAPEQRRDGRPGPRRDQRDQPQGKPRHRPA
jgi:sRNA-binding protein